MSRVALATAVAAISGSLVLLLAARAVSGARMHAGEAAGERPVP